MTTAAKEPPQSVPIQSVTIQQPVSSHPSSMLTGQLQPMMGNQFAIQQPVLSNGAANTGLSLGFLGIVFTMLGPFVGGFTCLFGWLFGLLGIIFGHIGTARAGHLGVGRAQGITGFVLGYITLALYVAPILFLIAVFEGGW